MDFESVAAVFELVFQSLCGSRQLSRLAYGNKPGIQPISYGGTEDEAARLHPEYQVDLLIQVMLGESIDQRGEPELVFQQRGDVVKQNAFFREIGNLAD